MFNHVSLRATDVAAAQRPLAAILQALEIAPTTRTDTFARWDELLLSAPREGHGPTRRAHVAFVAPSPAHVDAFWEAGIAAGLTDNGPAGPRPGYGPSYYAAFLLDGKGNNLEAVHRDVARTGGIVDHVALRTRDVPAAARFYRAALASVGVPLVDETGGFTIFADPGTGAMLSVADGEPTENLHLALDGDHMAVRRFHADALAAGGSDNGGPGERPIGTGGYFAAFVLDPDGNNVEVTHRGYEAG